ncbi:hypothetical protein AMS68_006102 [Peltaster fructicola]|uniref:CRAL-TRIO domain-containing protein n=1 Tax=Peltaster fructicola TaxID=286661 RepID=A0A6H0Y102_9PEZI|nr:hypothetical protein AMS68_006102 [Peltaster fructicola]
MSLNRGPSGAPMPAKLDGASLYAQLLETAKSQPPGRPGNLTAEQTAKLKEFWGRLLEIFGVYTPKPGSAAAAPVAAAPAPEKKKSGGLFGRKAAEPVDGNDKHGQGKTYQQALETMTPQELQEVFFKMTKQDAPDTAVLRYLRARKWDVQAALVMLVSTLHWRAKEMMVDDNIMLNGEAGALKDAKDASNPTAKKEGEDFIAQFRLGKAFVHGFDKNGRPCNYVRVKLHRGGEQTEDSIKRFTIFLIETTRFMITPPVDTGSIVFDMSGFTLANMDYSPVTFMIKCFEANYPESLGAVVIYKAPWIFQGIWKIIKGWLDPVVAAKVHFANNIKEMSEYIDPAQVTKECDGNDTYVYQYIEPVDGENAAMADTATRDKYLQERKDLIKKYDENTIQWIEGGAVEAQRARLDLELHLSYFKLDPYIRARSLYDRLGLIQSHNSLGWDKTAVDSALA